jgi:hypothetical protein
MLAIVRIEFRLLREMRPEEPIDLRRRRLDLAVRELASDVVEERRRRMVLEREVRELRARLAAYEATGAGSRQVHAGGSCET